jgi:D-3-phosphoglycerate dehydrogenase
VLQGIPNVILTPHIAGSTQEAQVDIGRFVAGKLSSFVDTGATTLSVNMPQLHLEHPDRTRLLHVHRNEPGVLATVNSILGAAGINVEGQQLSTRDHLGYLVTDTTDRLSTGVLEEIAGLPATLRLTTV